jgi:hypothetical protein
MTTAQKTTITSQGAWLPCIPVAILLPVPWTLTGEFFYYYAFFSAPIAVL